MRFLFFSCLILVQVHFRVAYGNNTITNKFHVDQTASAPSQCVAIENRFRAFLISSLDTGQNNPNRLRLAYSCLNGTGPQHDPKSCGILNNNNFTNLARYRSKLQLLYKKIAETWIEQEPSNLAKLCFLSAKRRLEFDTTIQNLKIQMRQESSTFNPTTQIHESTSHPNSLCFPLRDRWNSERDLYVQEVLSGSRKVDSIEDKELFEMARLFYSPLGLTLLSQIKYDLQIGHKEKRESLANAFLAMALRSENLKQYLTNLKDRELWYIYTFQNENSKFLQSLSSAEKDAASTCAKQASLFIDCLHPDSSVSADSIYKAEALVANTKRCSNRMIAEVLPFTSSYQNYIRAQLAQSAQGARSYNEKEHFRNLTFYIVMGVSGLFP